jgi:hypothetical protein
MYCPQCGAEYLKSATTCSDCQVALVPEPPGQPQQSANYGDEPLAPVWSGMDPRKHAEVLELLGRESIPTSTVRREDALFPIGRLEFTVYAPASLAVKANAILNPEDTSEETQEVEPQELDPYPMETPPEAGYQEGATQTRERDDWHIEDATAEIWSGEEVDLADMVRMSLRENQIPCRSSRDVIDPNSEFESESPMTADTVVKLYVLPRDEARAKQIVREIVDATPPA